MPKAKQTFLKQAEGFLDMRKSDNTRIKSLIEASKWKK